MKTLLGKKIGMTQIFTEDGQVVPVTVVEAGPEVVTQIKTGWLRRPESSQSEQADDRTLREGRRCSKEASR